MDVLRCIPILVAYILIVKLEISVCEEFMIVKLA